MDRPRPGVVLTIAALFFVAIAVESIQKAFGGMSFLLFGFRTDGLLEAIAASVHAALMLAIAFGIWRLKRYALYFLLVYTPYVLLNIILFSLRYDWPDLRTGRRTGALNFGEFQLLSPGNFPGEVYAVTFTLFAVGVPLVTAYLLSRRLPTGDA